MTDQVTVTLEAREARSLVGAANLMGELWETLRADDEHIASVIAAGAVPPVQAAAMKLELALLQAQIDP